MPENPEKKQDSAEQGKSPKKTRKHNTPKEYPNKGTGEGKNPRKVCPFCKEEGRKRYMNKVAKNFVIGGQLVIVRPLWFCKYKHIIWDEEELAKVPD